MESAPQPHQPYSVSSIVLYGGVLALASIALSFAMFWFQAEKPDDHLTGKVVSIGTDSLVVTDVRGATTTILLTPDTKKADIEPLADLPIGTRIISRGVFIDQDTFEADGIRKFQKRP
jgi:hypothetical protein